MIRACSAAALTIALTLAGCSTWQPWHPPAPLAESPDLPYRLRATMADSTRVELTAPFLRADTLYGRTGNGPRPDTTALSVTAVRGLERERFSLWRTLGATVGVPALTLGVVFVIVCGGGQCEPDYLGR